MSLAQLPQSQHTPSTCPLLTSIVSPERILAICQKLLPSRQTAGDDVAALTANISKDLQSLTRALLNPQTLHASQNPQGFEASDKLSNLLPLPISFSDFLARLLLEKYRHELAASAHPQAFTPHSGTDPRHSIDDLLEVHAASAGTSLLFTLAPPDWTALTSHLADRLSAVLGCGCLAPLFRHALVDPHLRASRTGASADTDVIELTCLVFDLLLSPMDHAIADLGLAYARFGQTGAVCALRESDLHTAQRIVEKYSFNCGVALLSNEITTFAPADAAAFLQPDLAAFPTSRTSEESYADQVLYVGRDGARVRVASGRVSVSSSEVAELSIPSRLISRVVLSGNVGLSAGARSWALTSDVPVCFLSRRGAYLGQLVGRSGAAHAQRLLAQVRLVDTEQNRLPLARAFVRAKLRNQVHLVQRLARRSQGVDVSGTCQAIRSLNAECEYVGSISELMGLEGAASEAYFQTLPLFIPPEVAFNGRSRRPPRDVANAALSYGYAILLSECVGALMAAGLEPSLGVLHASTDKRPSLALDLMEEFRPLLVDQTVMALLRSGRLRAEHACPSDEGGGVWLAREGKKVLTDAYEQTLQRSVRGALPGFAGSWRRHIQHEAQLLARAVVEPDYRWVGVVWR